MNLIKSLLQSDALIYLILSDPSQLSAKLSELRMYGGLDISLKLTNDLPSLYIDHHYWKLDYFLDKTSI